jgi:hypothetical protein
MWEGFRRPADAVAGADAGPPCGRPRDASCRPRDATEHAPGRPRRATVGETVPRGGAGNRASTEGVRQGVRRERRGGESRRTDRTRPEVPQQTRARIPYQPEPGFGGCFRQMSGKVRTSRPHGWPVAPGPGRTWIREHWFPWGTWGWSRALHRAGVMVVHERQGDGVSGNDTPFAMEKTTSGRSCVVSRGIAGGFSGIVYVG